MSDGVVVALIGASAACFGAVMSYLAARAAGHARDEAAAANRAVNRRPSGEPSIYELVSRCASDSKASRVAAEHAQSIAADVAGEQRRHLAWHQSDREERDARQAVLDEHQRDVVRRLDVGAARFAGIERALGIDPDDDQGET